MNSGQGGIRPGGIIGKHFLLSTNDYYTFGRFVDNLGDGFYLVYKTGCEKPHHCIFHLFNLSDSDDKSCLVFDTEEELNSYIKWIEEPNGEKKTSILKLVKNGESEE